MTALERIKEIESGKILIPHEESPEGSHSSEAFSGKMYTVHILFLTKAFHVMREIAIEMSDQELTSSQSRELLAEKGVDQEFEKRMSK